MPQLSSWAISCSLYATNQTGVGGQVIGDRPATVLQLATSTMRAAPKDFRASLSPIGTFGVSVFCCRR
ncbi:hypothetical protein DF048_19635 [Burkholderia seminalis]|nr:hypothetical protein DF048_19635 [Burkholderia seminalis]